MDKDKLLRRYLDNELSPEEEQQALHVIADDADMRSMLRFEQQLSDVLSEQNSIRTQQVPHGFTDSVMHQIEQREKSPTRHGLIEKVKSWIQQLWVPRQVQWRPAYGFAVVILMLFSFSYPLFIAEDSNMSQSPTVTSSQNLGSSVQQVSSTGDEVMLRFIYIGENAKSVAVAGDFSDWEPIEMTKQTVNGEQVWTGLVSMSRGEHHYMFVKDGKQWITDPLATVQRDDGFGNKNAVVYL